MAYIPNTEPLRFDDCGVEHPDHSPYCPQAGPGVPGGAYGQELRMTDERALAEALRERDEARQAADEQAESARAAQRDACLRGFAIVRAAFEAWRDGDKVTRSVGDDTDVFLALQATHLGFQALARALEKK